MHWNKELAYWITPKSGPMRGMTTLIDANHALSRDLPSGYLKRVHWVDVANLLVQAAESGRDEDVRIAWPDQPGGGVLQVQCAVRQANVVEDVVHLIGRDNLADVLFDQIAEPGCFLNAGAALGAQMQDE